MKRAVHLVAVLAAAAAAGCAADSGALSQVSFGAGCKAGQACVSGLDAPLAAGSRLAIAVDVTIPGSSAPPLQLESMAPDVFQVQGDTAFALAPGLGALLVTGPNALVLDFIHLWVAQADHLVPLRRGPDGAPIGRLAPKVTLLRADELLVSIEPFAAGQQLSGDFDVKWTGGENVVAVVPAGVDDWHRVIAREPGKAIITAEALGLSTTLELEVLP